MGVSRAVVAGSERAYLAGLCQLIAHLAPTNDYTLAIIVSALGVFVAAVAAALLPLPTGLGAVTVESPASPSDLRPNSRAG
jgi:hypothetical protein